MLNIKKGATHAGPYTYREEGGLDKAAGNSVL